MGKNLSTCLNFFTRDFNYFNNAISFIFIKQQQCPQRKVIRLTSTSSSSVTSTPENPHPPDISSTNVVVSIREPSKSMRRKPLISENLPSNTPGLWTSSRAKEKEVSPLIFLSGSSKPRNITSPSLMPQVTETSSRI